MNEVIKAQYEKAYKLHLEGRLNEAELLYNSILNLETEHPTILYLLANLYGQKGFNGLSINLLVNCLQAKPDFQEAWIDLGVSLKRENKDELAMTAWERAESLGPHHEIYTNMATLYADSGEPEKAIELCDKGLALMNPEDEKQQDAIASAHWNKALALLSLGKWKEAWKEHHWRKKLKDVWHPRNEIDAPLWDGNTVGTLYLHAEQGKGDEIMYLSMLKEVLPLAKRIVVEVNEAIADLVKLMDYPTVEVVTSQEEAKDIKFDAKYALGDLGYFFRNDAKDFDGKPYMNADPQRVEYYREELEKLGPGPYVGIAWLGGTKTTKVHKRTVGLGKWNKLLDGITAVSLQHSEICEAEATKHGIPVFGDASRGKGSLAEQAALIEACDYVITVAQTVVHLAGALGKKTYVLVSDTPSWRYGVKTDKMPWYGSVKLIRQRKEQDWEKTIEYAHNLISKEQGLQKKPELMGAA